MKEWFRNKTENPYKSLQSLTFPDNESRSFQASYHSVI